MALLAHHREGAGTKPVVLLHGFLGSGRNLGSLARRWAAADPSLGMVVLDLTGHGASPPLPPGADLFTLARDVLETAHHLALPMPVKIVGHSLGGRVALAASLLEPATVGEGVLLDIGPGPIPDQGTESAEVLERLVRAPDEAPDRQTMRAFLREGGFSPPIVEWLLTNLVSSHGRHRWRFDRRALAELHPRVNAADLWPAVERPGSRVRCIRGARSRYVSDADARRLETAGCPVVTLEDAGHFVHVDQPEALLAALLRP